MNCILVGLGCTSVTWDWLVPLLSLFWQKRRALAISGASSRGGDLTAATAKAFYLEPSWSKCCRQWERVSYWDVLMVRGREGRACPETLKQWLCCPCYWQRYCFEAWIENLEIRGVVSSRCWFGMVWSPLCLRRLVLQGWEKAGGAQSILSLTRGRSREQLLGTSAEQYCVSEKLWFFIYRCPCTCAKCELLYILSEIKECKVKWETQLLTWV